MSAFQLPSKVDFLNQLNKANGLTGSAALLASDFTYSAPQVVTGGMWRGSNSDRNSAVRLTGNGTTYQGSQVILYNRLDAAQLVNLPNFTLKGTNIASIKDFFAPLKYYTGLQVDTTDFQDLAVTVASDGSGNAQFTANPNSYGWQGSVLIPFTKGGVGLDSAVATPALPGLNYPATDASAPPASATQAAVYLYAYDFTAIQSTIVNYAPGVLTQAQADALVAGIKAVDVGAGKALWNDVASGNSGYTAWNLTGATIVSNGLNNVANTPTNPNYKYVMVLQLRADVTIPSGTLYLHYNDPFNPDTF